MDGYIKIGTEIDTTDFDAEIRYIENRMEEIEYKIKQSDMGLEVGDVDKLEAQYSKLGKQLTKLVDKQRDLGKTDLSGLKKNIDNAGNSITKAVKKVGQWALAIFGIRSAYLAVRSAMSTLTQYDDQMAVNVEYIRYALANILKPVIETLINLAYKFLVYINYIAKAWFNVDLFANASAKSFKKAKDGLSGANKEAKKLNKQLAGFDEMNILQENASTATGGGGGGGTPLPSFDLAAPKDEKEPAWLNWLKNNGKTVAKIITVIGFALAGLKITKILKDLGLLEKEFKNFKGLLLGLGIGLIIVGIYETIKSIVEYIRNPSWDNFANILKGLAIILSGVAVAMLAVNSANPVAWIILATAAFTALFSLITKNWDKIKKAIQGSIDWLKKNFANLGGEVLEPLLSILPNALQIMLDFVDNSIKNIKMIFDGLIKFIKGIFTGDWKTAFEGLKMILTGIFDQFLNILTTPFKAAWTIIQGVLQTISNIIDGVFNKLREGAQGAMNGIKSVFSGFASWLGNVFSSAWTKVKEVFSTGGKVFTGIKDGILSAFKKIVNTLIDGINKVVTIPFNGINNSLKAIRDINILGKKPFKGLISTISVPKIPHLAKGGIINMPGRGVPIGGAIAGEAGREGVIPLTDSQQMAMLGEAIGRYITINANITNTMNGRVISRELQKVQNANDFAYNR